MGEEVILRIVIGILTALGGAGSLIAWQRFRSEKRSGQLIIKAAEGAVVIQGGVLKNLKEQLESMHEEIAQMRMENIETERKHEECEALLGEVKLSVALLHKDLASHSRMSELARRKTHVAINTLGNYELLVENILNELRENNVPIKEELRPTHIREHFQVSMNELEDLEARVTQQAVTQELNEEHDAAIRSAKSNQGQD